MIYLDYNATTPIDKNVYKAMQPYLEMQFGNPSNSYELGQFAKKGVENARSQVADLIGAKTSEILFTGCGSESNNMVVKGVAYTYKSKGRHIVTSCIEHPAILAPLAFLEKNGYEVTYLPVNEKGLVNPEDLRKAIRKDTILVTVMHSNNEVGTLQPIQELGKICREKDVLFHTDASQSLGKVEIDVSKLPIDFLTIAGHKLYAPKGIGALYIRGGLEIEPLLHGASQESGRRAGTENVPYAVALGEAAVQAKEHLKKDELLQIREYFYNTLKEAFGDRIHLNGDGVNRLPNTLNVSFIGSIGGDILAALPEICASTGSACHSGSKTISPVLAAMGVEEKIALGAIRFSVGRYTTKFEIDQAVNQLIMYFEAFRNHNSIS
ncbi:MAG TPA: cysteine desulfurase [Clostridiales bacterium]|nr:cysteine desulfurase [Clostridiales bacterium]